MPPVTSLLILVVLSIGMAVPLEENIHPDQLTEIPVASVEFKLPSIPINFYTRQQLVLGPALNVTVREGDKALMPCIAPHLGDKTVSWIRQKDLAILISGNHVYTSDPRVESVHPSSSDLWGLQISPVRSTDEGLYQCQVNSEPKESRNVVLVVLEQDLKDSPSMPTVPPTTSAGKVSKMMTLKIAGGRERTVFEGSNLILYCSVVLYEEGLYGKNIELSWWHRNFKLSSKTSGTRVSSRQTVGETEVSTELVITPVQQSDSGTYHCKAEPKYFQQQTIKTFVLKESFVTLNVMRDHVDSSSFPQKSQSSVFLLLLLCCMIMFL